MNSPPGILAAAAVPSSPASTIIDRNARDVTLKVDGSGFTVVSYRVGKTTRNVLASGAIDDQVRFKLDYSGAGSGAFRKPVWKTVQECLPYDGPPLAWLVNRDRGART